MDTTTTILLIVLVLLLSLSAFFSSSETALTSVNVMKLRSMAKDNKNKLATAKLVYNMQKDYTRYLTTILVGNNIVNILASSLTTMVFMSLFSSGAVVYATVVMTVLVLVFGEVLPKTIASKIPAKISMFAAKPLYLFEILLRPITYLFELLQNGVNKLLKTEQSDNNATLNEEELVEMIQVIENEGVLNQDERELIESAIEFADVSIKEIMTLKKDIISINLNASEQEVINLFTKNNHSRLPVMDVENQEIIGILLEKDYLMNLVLKQNKSIEQLATLPIMMDSNRMTIDALEDLQRQKNHIAVVVEKQSGESIGIVTLEDILEVLVGEIYDESDVLPSDIVEIGLHNYEVSGQTSLAKLFSEYLEDTPTPSTDATSVAQWIKELLDVAKPFKDMETTYENLDIKILDVKDGHINKVAIEELTPKDDFFE